MTRALSLLLLTASAFGLDLAALKPVGYVNDFARVVDSESAAELEGYCARVEKATGVQIALVTLETLEGEPVEDVANDLFRRWGIGQKGEDEGLLLLLAVRDRRSRLEVGRGLEPYITDGTAGALLREMRPALQQQRYGDALRIAARSLGERVARAKSVQIPESSRIAPRQPSGGDSADIPWPVLIGGIFLLFWIMSSSGRRGGGGGGFLPGLILGNLISRSSYAGRGGGGFGGYDSGDSFGGFGGGDSGGGGASGSW